MNSLAAFAGTLIVELLLTIDTILLNWITGIYSLFLEIANARIFNNDLYANLSNRIYVIIGIVALFIVAYSFLHTIISVDSKKDNGADILKRIVISLVVVAVVPAMFDFLYLFQSSVLSGNVITGLILGNNALNNDSEVHDYIIYQSDAGNFLICDSCTETDYSKCIDDYGISADPYLNDDGSLKEGIQTANCKGTSFKKTVSTFSSNFESQKLISYDFGMQLLSTFFYVSPEYNQDIVVDATDYFPFPDIVNAGLITCIAATGGSIIVGVVSTLVSAGTLTGFTVAASTKFALVACGGVLAAAAVAGIVISPGEYQWSSIYSNLYIYGDFSTIIPFSEAILDGRMSYTMIISGISLAFITYVLVVFVLDLSLRCAKMAFYQIIAPIPIFMSILPTNEKLLLNWFKLVMTTYTEVFIRVGLLAGMTLILTNLNYEVVDSLGGIGKLVIIMGVIAFVQKAPKMISEVTGIKSDGMSLDIRKRLSENGGFAMAATAGGLVTGGARGLANGITENNWEKGNRLKSFGKTALKTGTSGISTAGRAVTTGGGYRAKKVSELKGSIETGYKQAKNASIRKQENMSRYENEYNGDENLNVADVYLKGKTGDALYNAKSWAHIEGNYDSFETKSRINKSVTEPFGAMRENMKVIMNNVSDKEDMQMKYNNEASAGKQKSRHSLAVQRQLLERYKKYTKEDIANTLHLESFGNVSLNADGTEEKDEKGNIVFRNDTEKITNEAEMARFISDFENNIRELEKDTTEYWGNKLLDEDYLRNIATSSSKEDKDIYNTVTAGPARKNLSELVENSKSAEANLKKNLGELNNDVASVGKHAYTVNELNGDSYKSNRFTVSADYSKSADNNEASNLYKRRNLESKQKDIKKDN